jgi:hypothetical protein
MNLTEIKQAYAKKLLHSMRGNQDGKGGYKKKQGGRGK